MTTNRLWKPVILSLGHPNRMENIYREYLDILTAMKTGNLDPIYDLTLVHMDRPKGINLEDFTKL